MNSGLETALKHARNWRDWGNWILIGFLFVEVLLEMWPELPYDWSPWIPPRKYVLWLDRYKDFKKWATISAALMVLVGVAIETYWGFQIDDTIDDMRIAAEPRPELLVGEKRNQLVARLNHWAGQSIELRFCPVYKSNDEAMQTVMMLGNILSDARWIGAPGYQIGPVGSGWIAPRESTCGAGQGLMVEKSALAPKRTVRAAEGLIAALKATPLEVFRNTPDDITPTELQPLDPSSVVLTVYAHPL